MILHMKLLPLEMDHNEVALTLRALREMRERAEITLQENDAAINLIDYIETAQTAQATR